MNKTMTAKSKSSVKPGALRSRVPSGAALAEAVSGLVVMAIFIAVTTLIVVSVGLFMIYKIKVGFVANQAAQYASGMVSWQSSYITYPPSWGQETATAQVNSAVASMCKAGGLPVPGPATQFATLVDNGGKRIQCKVTVSGFVQPFGANSPVPLPPISDTASIDVTQDQPPCILQLHTQNPGLSATGDFAIPSYGFVSATNPKWNNKPPYQCVITFPGKWTP